LAPASKWRGLDRRWLALIGTSLLITLLFVTWFLWVSRPPAMSAEETEADLRSYTAGDPTSYKCERQGWPYHWDYTCSFRSVDGYLTTIEVNVDETSIIEQTAP
jgi:hypothetical protein